MINRLLHTFLAVLPMLHLCSCSQTEPLLPDMSTEGSQPVEFEFVLPADTRAPEKPKLLFSEGDIIHIEACFTNGKEGDERAEVYNYGAMEFKGGQFAPVAGATLKWPVSAADGTFKAYYIHDSTGMMSPSSQLPATPCPLSSLADDEDPLEALSETFEWGHVVQLQFKHACTFLSIINMDPSVTDEYRLTKSDLSTHFYLERDEENKLALRFVNGVDNTNYIARPAENYTDADGQVRSRARFFLAPGDYKNFKLLTNYGDTYLSFDSPSEEFDDLKMNIPYTLDVQLSQGVTITKPNDEEWHEDEEPYDIDVPSFLKAIANMEDYYNEEGVQILDANGNVIELLHNVDFKFYDDYDKLDFNPNVNTGQVFNGKRYYIKNIGYPVFRYNFGTIENVGFDTVKAEVVSDEYNESLGNTKKDASRQGSICCWNRASAIIQNIRVNDVDLTVYISTNDSNETHNAGCLVGSNVGLMYNVAVSGTFSLKVQNYTGNDDRYFKTDDMKAGVNIGGFVGQNAGSGIISEISPTEGKTFNGLTVTNTCSGTIGTFYVGGAVGYSSSAINHITVSNVNVDSSESRGVLACVGGLAGRLASDIATASGSELSFSTVTGSVHGANSYYQPNFSNGTTASYTGGIAGNVAKVSVVDCRSTCDVTGPTASQNNVIYATGGAIGRILDTTASEFKNITAYGSILTGLEPIGNFAGLIPNGESWEANYQNNNIIVNTIVGNPVGGQSND